MYLLFDSILRGFTLRLLVRPGPFLQLDAGLHYA